MSDAIHAAVASFVPRIVSRSRSPRTTQDAAVLFVDAVSFTSRVGRLVESSPQGVEQLSALMSAQYAPQLQAVAEHGGEVVRFVGDALLAVMPAEKRTLQEATLDAVACGLALQRAPRPRMPDGDPLAIRVVVTAGSVDALRDEGPRAGHFVLAGRPLEELAAWAPRSGPGEVVLAPSAMKPAGGRLAGAARDGGLRVDRIDARAKGAPPPPEAYDDRLRRFVPRPVLDRIESGHLDWLAELRRVTAVFVAVRGLDVAAVPEVMARLRALAEQHEVFLKELVLDDKGWTVVALTGVPPFAGLDDAARAVGFAHDLSVSLGELGLRAAAGVASGRAFCGAVGSSVRREYAVTGTAMNLAARLSQTAEPGQTLCDEETAKAARGRARFGATETRRLKGFDAPVPMCTLERNVTAPAAHGRLVGRDDERTLLSAGLDDLAAGRATAAVLLEGEPGIGKSRLAADLLASAEARHLAHHVGVARSVDRTTPYQPWREVMAGVLRSLGALDEAGLRAALAPEDVAFAPLLGALVALGAKENETTVQLAGQLRARKTRELGVAVLGRAAARRPLFVLLEDLHWADAASWDLLRDVVTAAIPGLFVVATSRPQSADEAAAFATAGGVRRTLSGLPRAATAALLEASLGVREVEAALVDRLHERAAGNPLFAEQLALSLTESRAVTIEGGRGSFAPGVDIAAIALPATVEGAITARLDRLSPAALLAVKVASVIGPVFERRLLVDVHPHPEDRAAIDEHLAALRDAQLIVKGADDEHRFHHELVRDVAYETMLFEQRRQLHGSVATWIERERAGELDAYLAVLAHHHRNAGNPERAAGYLEQASAHTFRIGLPRQSVALGVDGASLLGVKLPTDPAAVGARIGELIGLTMTRLAGRAPAELLELPPMTDPLHQRIVRALLELAPFTFQAGRPDLYALLGLTLLDLALEHGHSAPDVYSTYSVVHRAIHHDARGGHAWSELALALDERQGGSARARVAFVHDWFHSHWLRPLRESVTRSLAAAEGGLAAGDLLFGCYNLSGHVIYAAASGRRLDEVIDLARAHLARNGRRVVNAAFHCIHEMQLAKALAGRTRAPLSLTDDEHDEERDVASICASDFYNQVGYYLVSRVKLHALFGDPAGALGWADKIGALHAAIAGQVAEIDLVLFRTLAEVDEGLLDRAEAGQAEVARWAEGCPANFLHLSLLLRAALAAKRGARDEALAGFARAAEAAEAEGFVQHAALAHERAARLDANGPHRRAALDAYRRWGAEAKVAALQ